MENDKVELTEVCRVCANKIKDKKRQRHIFNYLRGKLLQNLKLITGVELLPNDNLPTFICERCNSELDLAIKFRERCIFSQNYLEDMLEKERKEFLETVKNELSEDPIDEDQLEYVDDDDEDQEHVFTYEDDDLLEDLSAGEVVETLDEETEDEDLPAEAGKRHLVILEDSQPTKRLRNFFICEECGEYFKLETEYKEHLEGHLERKASKHFFPCYQCPSSFSSKAQLRQHRRDEHDGNRLFKCSVCGEGFLEHSAKQRHEIAHVNERPYPCLECKETFSSMSELRMHFPSHRKPKYRCEPCNEDFTTRKELLAHSNSHPHKRTMQQMQDEIDMLCGAEATETIDS
ncbi:hypothetical protein KR222_011425 [Zaprionus bogoriensis]|nr:hypothetical protein KR222_011425 [Zaprionus bogoriensis]